MLDSIHYVLLEINPFFLSNKSCVNHPFSIVVKRSRVSHEHDASSSIKPPSSANAQHVWCVSYNNFPTDMAIKLLFLRGTLDASDVH